MNVRFAAPILVSLAMVTAASAQDATPAPTPGPGQVQAPGQGPGGRGGWGGGMGMGRGVMGTVTEVAADHYTIKTDAGETYTVHFSVNTRMVKQQARAAGAARQGGEAGGNSPAAIKPTDIKVGDAIGAMGEVDAAARSVGAVMVMQLDPERAQQMRAMQANHGKTWIMGKVTAMDGVKVTLMDPVDNASHSFVADENTSFRKRREPITLADIQVGDMVRVEGAVKDGAFTATSVNAMGAPPNGNATVPRGAAAPTPPQ